MNCFQFDYFCGYHTAKTALLRWSPMLWIAFNLITFVDITQLWVCDLDWLVRCELLSIWLLLWISHSLNSFTTIWWCVVNCFQFDYFCGYHTATYSFSWTIPALWIAFNLITFVDITQLSILETIYINSCELLSIWLLLWISHSWSEVMNDYVYSCELLSIWLLLWISHSFKLYL